MAVVSGGGLRNDASRTSAPHRYAPFVDISWVSWNVIRDRDDGEQGGYEAGDPRREHEAAGQEGGQPRPGAELDKAEPAKGNA